MAQRTGGVRAPLSSARVYAGFASLVAGRGRQRFMDEHIRPQPGDSILDIGCGPGTVLELMPEGVRYLGIDLEPAYIDAARSRFGDRGEFVCVDVSDAKLPPRSFDLAIAVGILHHLDDDAADSLLSLAADALADGGRLVTLDGVFVEGQPPLARWVVGRDRGTSIRSPRGYEALAEAHFDRVVTTIHHRLLRIPYTHIALECSGPRRA
jgi:SAM-dependent methyltransferase